MSSDIIYKNIEKLGERYYREHLAGPARPGKLWSEEKLEQDWWEALKFFYSHSFMRGRRDKLSNEYYYFTVNVLEDFLSVLGTTSGPDVNLIENPDLFDIQPLKDFKKRIRNDNRKGSAVKQPDFQSVSDSNRLVRMLSTKRKITIQWKNESYEKEVRLDNDEDIMMVLETLKFTTQAKYNVYVFLRNLIADNKVKIAYNHLIEIRSVADKLATFILRDIGLINPGMKITSDYRYYFPVDVWVQEVAERIGGDIKVAKNADGVRNNLIQECKQFGVDNPLKFAAGLWYLGFDSLDLAIEFLSWSPL